MTTTSIREQIDELFADARQMHSQAVERLEQGDIRDAAETAWCATKRATDALLLARTGEQPGPTDLTSDPLTTWSIQIHPLRRCRAATTADSANCMAPVSTPVHATSTPSAASTKPPITLPAQKYSPPGQRPRHSNSVPLPPGRKPVGQAVIEKHQEEGRQASSTGSNANRKPQRKASPSANRYQARPTKITDLKNDRGAKAANPSPHAPDEDRGIFHVSLTRTNRRICRRICRIKTAPVQKT